MQREAAASREAADSSALLGAEVVARLRDMIVEGELAPGQRLNERVLCATFSVSRTPLREAIKVLAAEGLVTLLPNRGAVASELTPESIRQTFAVLAVLEGLAGELACANASDAQLHELRALHHQMLAHHQRGELSAYFRCNQRIHEGIVDASGNAVLAGTYRNLNGHLRRARYLANQSRSRWDQAVGEHEAFLAALISRNAPRTRRLLQEHLHNKYAVVEAALRERGADNQHLPAPRGSSDTELPPIE